MVKKQAGLEAAWLPPRGHRASAPLADKATLCFHQPQVEDDADFGNIHAASPERGVVAKGGLRAPPFSYKKRGETVPDVKGQLQLSAS